MNGLAWYWNNISKEILKEKQVEGFCIVVLEVKFRDQYKTHKREGSNTHNISINQERKLGDRRWLDTVVVLTVNYTDRRLEDEPFLQILSEFKGNRKFLGSGGSQD